METKELKVKYRLAVEEAYYKGNVDALDEIYLSDVIIHQPPYPDIKGLREYKQAIIAARQAFSGIHFDWEETICEGDVMAIRATWHMKHTGISPKIPVSPTDKEVVMRGSLFFNLKKGKIVEVFEYKDYLGFLKQLGVVPQQ